jgi:hypothetical protein
LLASAGLSEREIAARFHKSPSTIQRWLAAGQQDAVHLPGPEVPPGGGNGPAARGENGPAGADELAALAAEHQQLTARAAALAQRAAAARASLEQIEAERRESLAAGHDGTGFAARRRQALDDADDLEQSAVVLREDAAALEQRAAVIEAERAAEQECSAVARIMAEARRAAGTRPWAADLYSGRLAALGEPRTVAEAEAFRAEIASLAEHIAAGEPTPEQRRENAAYSARVAAEADAAQRAQQAELERLEARRQEWARTRRERSQSYLPERVGSGRAFTGPPPHVFAQTGR